MVACTYLILKVHSGINSWEGYLTRILDENDITRTEANKRLFCCGGEQHGVATNTAAAWSNGSHETAHISGHVVNVHVLVHVHEYVDGSVR